MKHFFDCAVFNYDLPTCGPPGGWDYCALKIALHQRSRALLSLDGRAGNLNGLPPEVTSQILMYLEEVRWRNIPSVEEMYLRRVGRTGQYGRKSVTINFVTEKDMDGMKSIETFRNCVIDELPVDFINYL